MIEYRLLAALVLVTLALCAVIVAISLGLDLVGTIVSGWSLL